jgi:hypothetical protein
MSAISSSTVVEQLPHHPKIKGLSPAATAGMGWEKMAKKYLYKSNKFFHRDSNPRSWEDEASVILFVLLPMADIFVKLDIFLSFSLSEQFPCQLDSNPQSWEGEASVILFVLLPMADIFVRPIKFCHFISPSSFCVSWTQTLNLGKMRRVFYFVCYYLWLTFL